MAAFRCVCSSFVYYKVNLLLKYEDSFTNNMLSCRILIFVDIHFYSKCTDLEKATCPSDNLGESALGTEGIEWENQAG